MKHLYSLAHLSAISLPPVDLIEVAARTGYEYVGLRLTRVTDTEPLYPIINSATAMQATKAALAQTGVRVWDVELARMDPAHSPEMYQPLLEAAQAPNAGMLVDMLHFVRSRSSLADLAALPRQWFHYAHLCDGPAAMPADLAATLFEARSCRLAPGEGDFGVKDILAAMPQDLTYVLEIPNDPVCAEIGFEGWARHILQTAQQHLDTDLAPKTNTRQETTA